MTFAEHAGWNPPQAGLSEPLNLVTSRSIYLYGSRCICTLLVIHLTTMTSSVEGSQLTPFPVCRDSWKKGLNNSLLMKFSNSYLLFDSCRLAVIASCPLCAVFCLQFQTRDDPGEKAYASGYWNINLSLALHSMKYSKHPSRPVHASKLDRRTCPRRQCHSSICATCFLQVSPVDR